MYARVVTVQYKPGKLEEGLQIFRDSMVPAARQTEGFKGGLGLANRSTGKSIAVTLRESVADIQATESSGFLQEQFQKVASLLAGTPSVEVYEVAVQEMQQVDAVAYARVLTATSQPGKIGDRVVVRHSARGTHRGILMGIPPTGKQISTSGIAIIHFANGKSVEDWFNGDDLGLMQQIGAIPSMG